MRVDIKRYVPPMLFMMVLQATTFFCFAQKPDIGLKAGFLISNNDVEYSNSIIKYTREAKKGALLGLVVEWPISKKFSFRPGLEFVIKGSKERHRGSSSYGSYDFAVSQPLFYLDVPLNLLYAVKIVKGKFIIGGGPVAGFYLGNNDRNYSLKVIDLGVNVVTGYEWPIGFFVNLNHSRGLKNISEKEQFVSDFQNNYYGLSVGYFF